MKKYFVFFLLVALCGFPAFAEDNVVPTKIEWDIVGDTAVDAARVSQIEKFVSDVKNRLSKEDTMEIFIVGYSDNSGTLRERKKTAIDRADYVEKTIRCMLGESVKINIVFGGTKFRGVEITYKIYHKENVWSKIVFPIGFSVCILILLIILGGARIKNRPIEEELKVPEPQSQNGFIANEYIAMIRENDYWPTELIDILFITISKEFSDDKKKCPHCKDKKDTITGKKLLYHSIFKCENSFLSNKRAGDTNFKAVGEAISFIVEEVKRDMTISPALKDFVLGFHRSKM